MRTQWIELYEIGAVVEYVDHTAITPHSKRYIRSSHYIFAAGFPLIKVEGAKPFDKLQLARQPILFHGAPGDLFMARKVLLVLSPNRGLHLCATGMGSL